MKTPIQVTFFVVSWHDWNEIHDLLEEVQSLARPSVPDFFGIYTLSWHVKMPEANTVVIETCYVDGVLHKIDGFQIKLIHLDLENGTEIWLNGKKISNDNYKVPISKALVAALK